MSSATSQAMVKVKIKLFPKIFKFDDCNICFLQPPIKVFGIDGRYATALFSAGSKQNKLEAIEKDLNKFQV